MPLFPWLAAALVAASAMQVHAQDFFLPGINYNIRKGPDAAAPADKCKNATQIAYELELIKEITDVVRLYSLVDCDQATAAIPAIYAAGLQLELGLWVGPNNSVYAEERELFKTLVQNTTLINDDFVVSIHVGSEAIYRKDVDTATAIRNFHEIKQIATDAGLDVPVSIGDIGDTYLAHPELFEAVDYVSANQFPFWEKVAAHEAAQQFYTRYQALVAAAATYNKTVVVGETGWASDGKHEGASEASPANAATFFHDFYLLAKQHNITYYYFAAFDESWKLQYEDADSTVEGYFGLFTADGTLKDEYAALELDSAGETDEPAEAGAAEEETVVDEEEEETDEEEEETPLKPPCVKPGDFARVKISIRNHKVAVLN